MTPYYQDEAVTIYHGDAREALPSLPKIRLVLTDPPYGLGKKLNGGSWGNIADWDERVDSDLIHAIDDLESEIIMWGGNYYFLPPCRGWLSWFKPDAPPSMAQFELAWRNVDRNARQISYSIAATNAERGDHPTQKPLAVMTWSIRQSDAYALNFKSEVSDLSADIILDPFMGSGTTLRAAKNLGYKAIGIEAQEKYCEIAAKRMSQEVLSFA